MAIRYTIPEEQLVIKLLSTLPRGITGTITIDQFAETPEWKELIKRHSPDSVRVKLSKTWKASLIEVKTPSVVEKKPTTLNHAFNYCPHCGGELNFNK